MQFFPHSVSSLRLLLGLSLVSLLPLGCTASISGDTPPGDAPGLPGGGAGPTGGSSATGGTGATSPLGQGAGPRPLQRLTIRQYLSSIEDLLGAGATPEAVQRFTPESVGESGFIGLLPAVGTLDARGYMEAAEAFTTRSSARIRELSPCATGTDESACARSFIQSFARKAYRRPLEASELDELLAVFTSGRALGYDYAKSLNLVVQAVLESPFFLYQWELGAHPAKAVNGDVALTNHELAARLSLSLWGRLPDAELSRAADAGELTSPDALSTQAKRLLADVQHTSDTLWDFYVQWLYIKSTPALTSQLKKNPQLFPAFDDSLKTSMLAEARGFLDKVVLTDSGSLTDLATARWSLLDGRLASVYGASGVSGDALARTDLPGGQRSGLFTQPLFLAALSSDGGTLPPRMGKTLWTRILCGEMAAIPANVPPPKDPAPNVTTRERFATHSEGACKGCHQFLDPLGFAFENYDALGRYRTKEGERDVDASGTVAFPSGQQAQFQNAVELLQQVATSADFSRCFSDQWLRYALGRRLVDADAGTPASVHDAFKGSGLNVKALWLAAVGSKAFAHRAVAEGEVVQ
jgi:Protein of unknown function (DUF1592)/Protein of unknown function (DUF1588)/Protein of unknown function (DUF1595)/Protein of unknown function (DUF1585)/Protein of unknown function (DUF1587)